MSAPCAQTRTGADKYHYYYCETCPARSLHEHHHHHQSLNRERRWGTTDDFATSFLQFSLLSTAVWDLANYRPVHSLVLSSHLFLYLPCLLPPFTMPCKMVVARPDERENMNMETDNHSPNAKARLISPAYPGQSHHVSRVLVQHTRRRRGKAQRVGLRQGDVWHFSAGEPPSCR